MLQNPTTEFLPGHRFRDLESDRDLKWIVFTVIFIHLFFFLFSAYFTPEKPLPKPVKQLIVKTITLNPVPQETIAFNEPAEVYVEPVLELEPAVEAPPEPKLIEKPLPKPEPAPKPIKKPKVAPKKPEPVKPTPKKPTPKKEIPKKPIVKKPAPKPPEPKPKPKPAETPKIDPKIEATKKEAAAKAEAARIEAIKAEAVRAKKRELLAKAQNSIAQLDTSSKLSAAPALTASVPSTIEGLLVETFPDPSAGKLNSQEMSYYDELASRLKLRLRLPEFGEVKVKLTLERSGQFVKVTIVSSKSDANRKYVEKNIPTLKFPGFGNNFNGMSQYTFVISLSNEL